jgi:hypothetical protein
MMEENNIFDHQQLYFPQWSTIFLLSAHSVIFVSGFVTNWFVTRYVERRKDAMKLFRRLALAQFKVGHLVNASRLILMFRLLVEFQQIGNLHLHFKNFLGLGMSLRIQGQEVKFHEIEIQLFHEVEFSIMRSKLTFFMKSNFFAKLIRRSNRP